MQAPGEVLGHEVGRPLQVPGAFRAATLAGEEHRQGEVRPGMLGAECDGPAEVSFAAFVFAGDEQRAGQPEMRLVVCLVRLEDLLVQFDRPRVVAFRGGGDGAVERQRHVFLEWPQALEQRVVHRDQNILVQPPRLDCTVGIAQGAVCEADVVIRLAALGLGRCNLLEDLERLRRVAPLEGDVAQPDAGGCALGVRRDRLLVGGLGGVDVAGRYLDLGQADQSRRIVGADRECLLRAGERSLQVTGRNSQQQLEVGPLEVGWRQFPELVQAGRRRVVKFIVQVARAEIAEGVRRQLRLHGLQGVFEAVRCERPVVA